MIWLCGFIFFLVFLPETSYAWGPLTHAYLAEQLLSLPSVICFASLPLIKLYKEYFIYGNLAPDNVIGKKYLPEEKNPHSWKTALILLEKAKTPEQKSFAYGYLTHLAADAVLHRNLEGFAPLRHAILELKADAVVDRSYWLKIVTINKLVKKRSEKFFEKSTKYNPVSFKASKKIYSSLIYLSVFNSIDSKNYNETLRKLQLESLKAMVDIIKNKENSHLINISP